MPRLPELLSSHLPSAPAGAVRAAAVIAALGVALASILHSGAHVEGRLRADRASYAAIPAHQRERLYITDLGLPSDPFDWYAVYVLRGDRLFYQVQPSGLGEFVDLPHAVEYVGRYALLPAVSANTLAGANTIVTWGEDPGALRVPFVSQERLGKQLFFVSRVRR